MRERKSKRTVQIGFGNSVMLDRVVGIFSIDTRPVKKMVTDSKETGFLIDLTRDKKMKTAILLDNDYVIITAISQNTIVSRIEKGYAGCDESEDGN